MTHLCTTLNNIHAQRPCKRGWVKLLNTLGKTQPDDAPVAYSLVLDSNGLDDALWCMRAEPQYTEQWLHFAQWCAKQVAHLKNYRAAAAYAADAAAYAAYAADTAAAYAAAAYAAYAAAAAAYAAAAYTVYAADAAAAYAARQNAREEQAIEFRRIVS